MEVGFDLVSILEGDVACGMLVELLRNVLLAESASEVNLLERIVCSLKVSEKTLPYLNTHQTSDNSRPTHPVFWPITKEGLSKREDLLRLKPVEEEVVKIVLIDHNLDIFHEGWFIRELSFYFSHLGLDWVQVCALELIQV